MLSLIAGFYPWLKALHVVCVILWVGPQLVLGLLVLALRHRQTTNPSRDDEFVSRLGFLVNGLLNVAMLGAFLFGTLMACAIWAQGGALPGWLWSKIGLVFALSTLHGLLFRQFRHAMRDQTIWGSRRFDLVQALGLGATLAIVLLVVVKPTGNG
ncbi:CopD family protein [Dechloromonas sp. A34]|uniref:CopD family protein n=1 Tax=Dechloromonas sp. A34 TaxID=447588 RepID=UPI002248FE41|nr:CopD family protein [Dechloromonas sp. A34]